MRKIILVCCLLLGFAEPLHPAIPIPVDPTIQISLPYDPGFDGRAI